MRSRNTTLSAFVAAAVICIGVGGSRTAAAQTVRVRPQLSNSGRIGIGTRDVTAADVSRERLPGEFGAYVNDVEAEGPADKAGMRSGDVIVEFDGVRVRSSAELQRLVRETPPGRTVKVGLVRDGRHLDLAVTTDTNGRDYSFRVPMPEFREGPLQPPYTFRWYPDLPSNRVRPPSGGTPFVYPGSNAPRLGIGVQDLTPQLAEYFRTKEGVLVATVNDGSPAAQAGVKAGDIIVSIDGKPVAHSDDVSQAVGDKQPGEQVTLGIVRNGRPLTIKVAPQRE